MSSPAVERSPGPSARDIAAAAERRSRQQAALDSEVQYAQEHEKRQEFRRLIEPGIFRPNSKEVAITAISTLSTIADNLLREPDNPKFQKFKPTNPSIKQRLVDPKGALEYAIALGFRAEVENFQPFYVFNPRYMSQLRIGAGVLHEILDQRAEQEERLSRWKEEEKAVAANVQKNVKLAFLDDRKTKMQNDKREKERMRAKAEAEAKRQAMTPPASPATTSSPGPRLPGSGRMLGDVDSEHGLGSPPPYDNHNEDDTIDIDDSD